MKTQFELDLQKSISINGKQSSRAIYNLIISIRDVKLFIVGLKPNRHWRLKDVKWYFGLKGNKEKVLQGLENIYESFKKS